MDALALPQTAKMVREVRGHKDILQNLWPILRPPE